MATLLSGTYHEMFLVSWGLKWYFGKIISPSTFPQYHFKPRDRNIPWCSLLQKSPSVCHFLPCYSQLRVDWALLPPHPPQRSPWRWHPYPQTPWTAPPHPRCPRCLPRPRSAARAGTFSRRIIEKEINWLLLSEGNSVLENYDIFMLFSIL